MGVAGVGSSPRSSYDDDAEAALNPSTDANDTVAPLFQLRQLAQGQDDASSAFLPGAGDMLSVYVTMHR